MVSSATELDPTPAHDLVWLERYHHQRAWL